MPDSFEHHDVTVPAEVPAFGAWLIEQARLNERVAVALRPKQKLIAFSTTDDSWLVGLKSSAGPLLLNVLRNRLIVSTDVKLIARNLSQDLLDLTRLLSKELDIGLHETYMALASVLEGDLTAAAACINQTVTDPKKFRRLDHDAYEVALILPQYEHGISAYYYKVGVPLARAFAETVLFAKGKDPDWWVTFPHLWLRVFAFYSGDPTLAWAFAEDRDPYEAVAKVLHQTPQEAELNLLWHVCGQDQNVFVRYTGRLNDLPLEDLPAWHAAFEKGLPAAAFACSQIERVYFGERLAETRFGRRLRPGKSTAEALAFRIFATVEEILTVAAVTFIGNRPSSDVVLTGITGGPAAQVNRVNGVGPAKGQGQWSMTLKELSTLAHPLTPQLPLKASVVQR